MILQEYRKHQGKYPVIFLTFKDVKFDSWEETVVKIRGILQKEFGRHQELLNSSELAEYEKAYFAKVLKEEASEVEMSEALERLSQMLATHYGKAPIIIIDEYDTPIQEGYSKDFYDEIIGFMRNFFSGAFKDNKNLSYGFLTGILRIAQESIFSGLNNLMVNSVMDEAYDSFFGFTSEEVREMLNYYGVSEKEGELKDWYDGYSFGSEEIYNPWSVANYFYNNCQAKPYWTNTSDNEIIREIMISLTPDIAENLFALLQGQTVQASLNMDVIYPRITDGTDTIFSFLLLAGYLKPVSNAVETEFGTFMELALPNKEIRRVYNTEILSWLRGTVDGNVMAGLEKALYLNDGKKLQEFLRKYMITCISCFDGAAEGFYHGMMLGLAAGMSSRYYIRSNRESGEGRFDLVWEPKVHSLPGIIMEFKATKNDAGLSASADEALKQIEDKHYDTDMKDRGIKEIVKYGIAFAGKNVEIANG